MTLAMIQAHRLEKNDYHNNDGDDDYDEGDEKKKVDKVQ